MDTTPSRLLEPPSYVERLDLEEIFGRRAPLQVDLGCADGSFLCALAGRMPENNFLGVERLLGRARSAARKAPGNMRVLRLETSYAVRYLLPPASVDIFYLLFPDPWPKRRHQRRRVVNEDFLDAINAALVAGGRFHFATDQHDYFEQIEEMADARLDFVSVKIDDVDLRSGTLEGGAPPGVAELPPTKFEMIFREQGLPIYRLELENISPVT